MVAGILIYSLYCANCELLREGEVRLERAGHELIIKGQGAGIESGFATVRDVCSAVGIPVIAVDIGRIMGYEDDEAYTLHITALTKNGLRHRFVPQSIYYDWVIEWSNKDVIELPSFIVKSPIAKNRYITLEPRLDDPFIPLEWVAARQMLRVIARVAIEEKLMIANTYSFELVENILNRLFPVRETGKVDPIRWIRSFLMLQKLKIRR